MKIIARTGSAAAAHTLYIENICKPAAISPALWVIFKFFISLFRSPLGRRLVPGSRNHKIHRSIHTCAFVYNAQFNPANGFYSWRA